MKGPVITYSDFHPDVRIGNIFGARHAYRVGIADSENEFYSIEVHANNRAQARAYAELAGYVVRDVNMIG